MGSLRLGIIAVPTALVFALPAPVLAQPKVTIKLNLGTPPGNPYNVGAEAFKKEVETDTKGDVTVQIFPSAQLGGEVESAKNVQLGTLDATIVSTSNLASFYDRLSVFSVPYLFKSVSCSFPVVDGAVGKEMADHLLQTAHMRVLGYPTFGARHLLTPKSRVIHPDDLKGLKIRAPDPLLEATWRALGANPTPLPFPEVFNALQQGVIDGDANPLTSVKTFRWYEAVKYLSLTNTAVGIGVFIINEPLFQRLSKPQQDAVLRAAADSIRVNRASEANLNKEAEVFLRRRGCNSTRRHRTNFAQSLHPCSRKPRSASAASSSNVSPRIRRAAERRGRLRARRVDDRGSRSTGRASSIVAPASAGSRGGILWRRAARNSRRPALGAGVHALRAWPRLQRMEEIIRMLFVWVIFVGAAAAMRRNVHIRVEAGLLLFPELLRPLLAGLVISCSLRSASPLRGTGSSSSFLVPTALPACSPPVCRCSGPT